MRPRADGKTHSPASFPVIVPSCTQEVEEGSKDGESVSFLMRQEDRVLLLLFECECAAMLCYHAALLSCCGVPP